jgi:hypothetical protein
MNPMNSANSANPTNSENSEGSSGGADATQSAMSEFRSNLFSTYQQMTWVKDTMQENQEEIDGISQQWTVLLQRTSLSHQQASAHAKSLVQSIAVELHNLAQSLPRTEAVTQQHRFTTVMNALYAIRADILKAQTAHRESVNDEVLLSTAISTKAVRKALQLDDSESGNWGGVVQFLEEQTLEVNERILATLDQIIEGYREIRRLDRIHETEQRNNWSSDMEGLNQHMEGLMATASYHQTLAYETLVQSQKLKKYLKHITGQQFKLLEWHSLLHTHLAEFGKNFDSAQRLQANTLPLFAQLLELLQTGETHPQPPLNGCDGAGGKVDSCGVCNGDNSTCVACNGIANDPAVLDVCGVCGAGQGHDCRYFCDGQANSGKVEDLCGICGGMDKMCAGCDGLPFSTRAFDLCGVCGGDGSSCATQRKCSLTDLNCPHPVQCPFGKAVTHSGFVGCCFDPAKDCV